MAVTNKQCLVSVTTSRYLPQAFILSESFIANNPFCDVLLFLTDLSTQRIGSLNWSDFQSVTVFSLDCVENPLLYRMREYFNAFEFCCAAKSFVLDHSLFRLGYQKAVFLDPDIFCYASFDKVWADLDGADLLVTPHVNSPMPADNRLPDDREMVTAGFVNGGFWAARANENTRRCLAWIAEKVTHYGFFIPDTNLYADQTWMSCLPWFFPVSVQVLRDPGLNVAYWNLHERTLSFENGVLFSNGERLVFFHFSGYDPANPTQLTKHSRRELVNNDPAILRGLLLAYKSKLDEVILRFPDIQPDLPCSSLALQKRIRLYKSIHRHAAKFTIDGQGSCSSRVLQILLRPLRRCYRWLASE